MLLLDVVNNGGDNLGPMVWDLVFWVFVRSIIAAVIFSAVAGLGALISSVTDNGGWAGLGVLLGIVVAGAWELWALYNAVLSLIVLVNVLGWFQ
jgi:hypothetical protein